MRTWSFMRLLAAFVVFLFLGTSLSGCTEYWWTRGQPPSVDTLVQRADTKLETALKERGGIRSDVSSSARSLRTSLLSTTRSVKTKTSGEQVSEYLNESIKQFMNLEGKLSIGSRAAYGELSGQLRMFHQRAASGERLDYASFGLFTSRVLAFLANELSVPEPLFE